MVGPRFGNLEPPPPSVCLVHRHERGGGGGGETWRGVGRGRSLASCVRLVYRARRCAWECVLARTQPRFILGVCHRPALSLYYASWTHKSFFSFEGILEPFFPSFARLIDHFRERLLLSREFKVYPASARDEFPSFFFFFLINYSRDVWFRFERKVMLTSLMRMQHVGRLIVRS